MRDLDDLTRVTRERIVWDEDEKRAIVAAAVSIRRKRPSADLLKVLVSAIATLPEHRRRTINTMIAVPWFELAFVKAINISSDEAEVNAKELVESKAKIVELEAWNITIQGRNTELEDDARQLRLKLETGTVDQIDDILSRVSMSQLLAATHFKMSEQASILMCGFESLLERLGTVVESVGHAEAVVKPSKQHKKRIAIAGGTNDQFRTVIGRYLTKAEFKHIDTSHSSRALAGLPVADKVFVFGNFTNKGTHETLINHYGRPKVVVINGGLTGLSKAVLAELGQS